jgi:hypothetical protein
MGVLAAVLKAADLMAAEMSAAARVDRTSPPDTDRLLPADWAVAAAQPQMLGDLSSDVIELARGRKYWRALQESNLRPAA